MGFWSLQKEQFVNTQPDLDRFCPTRTDDPYWNESAWFSFSIPERGIHGMLYYFFRPNMNIIMGGPIVWDATGAHTWDCLYHDWHHIQPIPADAEKFAFLSNTSLHVQVLEPLRTYKLDYDCNGLKLDLTWQAVAEPHHFLGMEISATGASPENRMHFEQMGRVTGVMELRGDRFDVDSYALRDTSWGRRQIDTVTRGSYFWAIADEKTAFHAQTKGDGADQEVVGGFLTLDGRTVTLASGRRVDTVMGSLTPDSFRMELEDQEGRTAQISARLSSHLMFNGFPRNQVVWSLLDADFGNGIKGWGDIQEFQPMEQFRAMVRRANIDAAYA
jgi:hypothetical protein